MAFYGGARAQIGDLDPFIALSCASWLQNAETESVGEVWITGFWSGMNAASPDNNSVGMKTNRKGILGEVKKYCKDHPSNILGVAVAVVHARMARLIGARSKPRVQRVGVTAHFSSMSLPHNAALDATREAARLMLDAQARLFKGRPLPKGLVVEIEIDGRVVERLRLYHHPAA